MFQQLSGAVMAKGAEDTASYRYSGLLSHAEVGCDPDYPSAAPADLDRLARQHRQHRSSLNATSTHDSKRNEDARGAAVCVFEAATSWSGLVKRWHHRHLRAKGPGPYSYTTSCSLTRRCSLCGHLPASVLRKRIVTGSRPMH